MTFQRKPIEIVTTSTVDAPIDQVWDMITTPDGINFELSPYLKMTVPKQFRGVTIDDIDPEDLKNPIHLGRSFFFFLGFLPIDYDNITIAEVDRGLRFREQSTMMSMKSWSHERVLTADGAQTFVRDNVSFVPRAPMGLLPGWGQVLKAGLSFLFRHRHRRLAAWAAGRTAPAGAPQQR